MLTAEKAKELLDYNPETGWFAWRSGPRKGRRAGGLNSRGYRHIGIGRRYYKAHRLAFLFMSGDWPEGVVDHINWITDDNRWGNLRDVPQRVNAAHRHPSAMGHGVHFHAEKRRWEARAWIGGRRIYLGSFPTKAEALSARRSAINHAIRTNTLDRAAA